MPHRGKSIIAPSTMLLFLIFSLWFCPVPHPTASSLRVQQGALVLFRSIHPSFHPSFLSSSWLNLCTTICFFFLCLQQSIIILSPLLFTFTQTQTSQPQPTAYDYQRPLIDMSLLFHFVDSALTETRVEMSPPVHQYHKTMQKSNPKHQQKKTTTQAPPQAQLALTSHLLRVKSLDSDHPKWRNQLLQGKL